ncbi:MAG: hypothetical protein SGJ20_22250 [Planctomycetota bacterium]|nr:hypothetical protein [Planctomycetota bacterium]
MNYPAYGQPPVSGYPSSPYTGANGGYQNYTSPSSPSGYSGYPTQTTAPASGTTVGGTMPQYR